MSDHVRIEVEHPHDPAGDILVVDNWLSYEVESDMFTPADAFTLRVAPTAEYLDFFRIPGHPVRIYYGQNLIMTGIIDATPTNVGDHGPEIELTGRDLAGLLVDDAAPLLNLTNQSLRMILEKLIAAHSADIPGIITDASADAYGLVGKRIKKRRPMRTYAPYSADRRFKSKTQPGEKIWGTIDRLAKHIGMTAWMTSDGKLCISRPNYFQDSLGKLFVKIDDEGNTVDSNCLMSRTPDIGDRYSDYTCLGQGRAHATSSGKDIAGFKSTARDPSRAFWWDSVSRRRQKINVITVKNTSSKAHLTRFARTMMEQAACRSYNMTATVAGHEVYPDGPLWAIDNLVDVEFGPKAINDTHYIVRRRFAYDIEGGKSTDLTPIPADLWLALDHSGFDDASYFDHMDGIFQRYAL